MKKISAIIFSILLTVFIFQKTSVQSWAADRYQDLQMFAKILSLVEEYYTDDVDLQKLMYGSIKGMLSELDPHTYYMKKEYFKQFEAETSGKFGGLGVEVTIDEGILTVITPIDDGPAQKAGVLPGDKVISINGKSTKGMSLADAAEHMKGKIGSKIRIQVLRKGAGQPIEIAIKRKIIRLKSVKYINLDKNRAYFRISSFVENTGKDLKKLIDKHIAKQGELSGIILDLRRNPGGLLDQAIFVSDLFVDEGIIVSTRGKTKESKEIAYAKKSATYPKFKIVVLIDKYSASASEIVAGALKDHNRATIMGRQSFGKGSVQSVIKLGDGSALKLTIAKYYTPNGTSIDGVGVAPHKVIKLVEKKAKKADEKAIKKKAKYKKFKLTKEVLLKDPDVAAAMVAL